MAKLIRSYLERVMAWFAPRYHRNDYHPHAATEPAPQPTAPLIPKAARLTDPPVDDRDGPVYVWVTAHGIDIKHRRPSGTEAVQ
ncbi:hypothetical protein ABT104_18475 [Streptomyces mobaraensis]|uniref:hypothetical protein n=1 Tax=Streptomyces mobaraensis TaxID=35621 RepID=UPI0033310877